MSSQLASDERSTSVISQEAYELHDCFIDELKDVVYELAEAIARSNKRQTEDGLTEITKGDMAQAASILLDSVRKSVERGDISPDVALVFKQMSECVNAKVGDGA